MEHQDVKEKYLSNKRTLLSVPGTLKTDAYVSVYDSSVHLVELTANLGRYTSSLSTSQFAGVGQVLIPNNDILGNTFLHLELPAPEIGGSWMVPQGWGWAAIKSVSYLWGSSNVSQITLSGKSLWAIAMSQCDTAEKRSQLCYLGGTLYPVPTAAGSSGLDDESIGLHAYIPLSLPWSVMCHGGKIGFDTALINSPITIQVQFASSDEFMAWGASRTNASPQPNGFKSAEVVVRQQMFTNRAQSLQFEMQDDPKAVYNYPFTHYQSAQFDFTAAASGRDCDVPLTNFINADLIGMVVYMVEKDKLVGGSKTNGNDAVKLNPLDITLPSDIKLLFNGQVLFNSPGKLYLLQNCANLNGSGSYYSTTQKVNIDAVSPNIGKITLSDVLPTVKDLLFIDFSRKHSPCFEKEYPNTFRIANQVLSLKFNMPSTSLETKYTLFATYIYNGVNSVQQGASNLYFD